MQKKKNRIIPSIIVFSILVSIIYLFVTVKQPYVECSKSTINDLGVTINEVLIAELDSSSIDKMILTKKIILPDKYLKSDKYLEEIRMAIDKSYNYLGDEVVKVSKGTNYVIVEIEVEDDETLILNNISFTDKDGLNIKINPNTKSSEVVTLKIDDKYTEGELMTRMKNNGYICK